MKCPFCKNDNDKVIDSRSANESFAIRRRRECLECQRRYTTYERIEELPLRVIKKDTTRVPFNRKSILNGIMKACEKRPISIDIMEEITNRILATYVVNRNSQIILSFVDTDYTKRLEPADILSALKTF